MHLNSDLHLHPSDVMTIKTVDREDGARYPAISFEGRRGDIYPRLMIYPGSFDDLAKLRDQISDYLDSLQPEEPPTVELPAPDPVYLMEEEMSRM